MLLRRTFVILMGTLALSFKSILAKTSNSSKGQKGKDILSLICSPEEQAKIIELKNGMIIELPANPACISSVYTFSVAKVRFGKSPIILLNNQPFNGELISQINVKKDLNIFKSPIFNLQYVGPDIGWIFLHS